MNNTHNIFMDNSTDLDEIIFEAIRDNNTEKIQKKLRMSKDRESFLKNAALEKPDLYFVEAVSKGKEAIVFEGCETGAIQRRVAIKIVDFDESLIRQRIQDMKKNKKNATMDEIVSLLHKERQEKFQELYSLGHKAQVILPLYCFEEKGIKYEVYPYYEGQYFGHKFIERYGCDEETGMTLLRPLIKALKSLDGETENDLKLDNLVILPSDDDMETYKLLFSDHGRSNFSTENRPGNDFFTIAPEHLAVRYRNEKAVTNKGLKKIAETQDKETITVESNIFSAGCLIYYACTGKHYLTAGYDFDNCDSECYEEYKWKTKMFDPEKEKEQEEQEKTREHQKEWKEEIKKIELKALRRSQSYRYRTFMANHIKDKRLRAILYHMLNPNPEKRYIGNIQYNSFFGLGYPTTPGRRGSRAKVPKERYDNILDDSEQLPGYRKKVGYSYKRINHFVVRHPFLSLSIFAAAAGIYFSSNTSLRSKMLYSTFIEDINITEKNLPTSSKNEKDNNTPFVDTLFMKWTGFALETIADRINYDSLPAYKKLPQDSVFHQHVKTGIDLANLSTSLHYLGSDLGAKRNLRRAQDFYLRNIAGNIDRNRFVDYLLLSNDVNSEILRADSIINGTKSEK